MVNRSVCISSMRAQAHRGFLFLRPPHSCMDFQRCCCACARLRFASTGMHHWHGVLRCSARSRRTSALGSRPFQRQGTRNSARFVEPAPCLLGTGAAAVERHGCAHVPTQPVIVASSASPKLPGLRNASAVSFPPVSALGVGHLCLRCAGLDGNFENGLQWETCRLKRRGSPSWTF